MEETSSITVEKGCRITPHFPCMYVVDTVRMTEYIRGSRSRSEAFGMVEPVVPGHSDAHHAAADFDFPGAACADEMAHVSPLHARAPETASAHVVV